MSGPIFSIIGAMDMMIDTMASVDAAAAADRWRCPGWGRCWYRPFSAKGTLRPVGDILLDGYDLHAVLFQNPLVVGAVIAVTGKTVDADNKVEAALSNWPSCA